MLIHYTIYSIADTSLTLSPGLIFVCPSICCVAYMEVRTGDEANTSLISDHK